MERFARTRLLLGEEGFKKLQESSVTVVGLGAVGGHAVEGLARSGIFHLRVVDFDTVQPSNINRQILALDSTIGRAKALVAIERIKDINPACQVEALEVFAGEENLDRILTPAPSLLIDAIDSVNPKIQLLTAAYHRRIPILSSMGAALRLDPTKIQIGDLFSTRNCPLARRLRKRLKQNGVGPGIECVYSTEKVEFDYQPPVRDHVSENPYSNRGRARSILGSLPTLTGIFGLYLANRAILRLAGKCPDFP
jgi:tRNA A37 threonylcarbamoyladenosine dehydratase